MKFIDAPERRDAQGGGSVEAGRMITCIMTSESSSKEAVIIAGYQPTFPGVISP